jgi:prepilin-type N-terminal cleavage/methylation domain-containing protein
MKIPSINALTHKTRRGMTLIEVMLSIAIIAIMAVLGAGALFYPRYLVVTSALEQNAIHAGSAEIERRLRSTNSPAASGQFSLAGWNTAAIIDTDVSSTNDVVSGDNCDYYKITTTITYRDGKQVKLVTYRSLEVDTDER